jgi:hypothetical protein
MRGACFNKKHVGSDEQPQARRYIQPRETAPRDSHDMGPRATRSQLTETVAPTSNTTVPSPQADRYSRQSSPQLPNLAAFAESCRFHEFRLLSRMLILSSSVVCDGSSSGICGR